MARGYQGLKAFVTGASSGIGRALALELAQQGADVAVAARREDRLRALAGEIQALGRRALALPLDVTDEAAVERSVAAALAELGALDVVVANAGFGVVGTVESLTMEDFRRQLETNLFGVLHTVKATLPALRRTKGRLALMGSVSGYVSVAGTSAYAMSKFAVRALAAALHAELHAAGVSVTLLSPGYVESEIRTLDRFGRPDPKAEDRVPSRFVMPVGVAAAKMARAIRRRRRERILTAHGQLAVLAQRFAPSLLRLLDRRRARRLFP